MRKNKQIRIISGEFGGRNIDTPKTDATQPMGDRERMAIFNRLREEFPDARVLDAFAGSGALGLEALSLGAKQVDFLEKNKLAQLTIKSNCKKLGVQERARLIKQPEAEYDIIFADPPYDNPQYGLVEELVGYLKIGGFFVLSHPSEPKPPEFIPLSLISDRKYAAANIKIYQKH